MGSRRVYAGAVALGACLVLLSTVPRPAVVRNNLQTPLSEQSSYLDVKNRVLGKISNYMDNAASWCESVIDRLPVHIERPTPENVEKAAKIADEADKLVSTRSADNFLKASTLYESAAKLNPTEPRFLKDAADSLNSVMRIQTNGNLPCYEGSNDTPQNREVWGQHAEKAKTLAQEAINKDLYKKAMRLKAKDPEYLSTYTDSYVFEASLDPHGGKGESITHHHGHRGQKYTTISGLLKLKPPEADPTQGFAMMAEYYLEAPEALRDEKKAMSYAKQSLSKGVYLRDLYLAGVISFRAKDYEKAASYFDQASKTPFKTLKEEDYGEWIHSESKKGAAEARKRASTAGTSITTDI
mmetsp:Transcript_9028/g.13516  ORF Transcript_9028/g.13516 Transcript_9028/m.13516 type:complete len:354 (+) Transcript_9028:47-1108(+)